MTNYSFHQVLQHLGRPVTYYPSVCHALGGNINVAIFLSNFYYWKDKGKDADGWIYKSRKEIEDETGLSRHKQDNARRALREMGLLEEKLAGSPAVKHYKFNWLEFDRILSDYFANLKTRQAQSEARQPSTVNSMREIFCQKYEDFFDIKYEWMDGKDYGNTGKLRDIFAVRVKERNIKNGLPEGEQEATKEQIINNFTMFLDSLPEFHKKRNFTPALLYKHFNNIIMEISNERNQSKRQPAEPSASDFVRPKG